METQYEWTFEIKDLQNFEETSVTVYSPTYEQALRKVKAIKIPKLRTFNDIEDALKLKEVIELSDDEDDEITDIVTTESN